MSKTAPAKAKAPVEPKAEWTDLAIAAQLELLDDGTLINPFTKEPVAKNTGGLLDVRRPSSAALPKPENVKIVGGLAKTFAKWYFDKCAIGAITAKTVSERFGIPNFELPDISIETEEVPYALITGNYGDAPFAALVVDNKIIRIGKQTDRGYVWAHADALRKARGDKMCPRSVRAENADDAFKALMGSFEGKFRVETVAPKAPTKSKAPPSKVPPKKVPTRKA